MSMGISTPEGQKVVFSNPDNGTDFCRQNAKKHLKVGRRYTVNKISIGEWSSIVEFKNRGLQGKWFNTSLFEND